MMRSKRNFLHVQSPVLLLLTGLFLSYVWFFVYPVFLNPERTMQFVEYIVKIDPIGLDLAQMLDYSRTWFIRHQSPYVGANLYSPLTALLFVPFLFVKPVAAYHLMTLLNLLCCLACVLVLPYLLNRHTERVPLLLPIFLSALCSYGFHFELERGQFNLLAMTCCLLALHFFHSHRKGTVPAYLLFCLAVQLKLYPAIFVLLFVKDWRDRRGTLLRMAGLLLANVGLLFVLGIDLFQDFLAALIRESGSNLWIGNHSIRAFVLLSPLPWKTAFQILLVLLVLVLLGTLMLSSYRQRPTGFNAPLFFSCTIAALLIPSVSNDYKLVLLAAAMSVAFPHKLPELQGIHRVYSAFLLLLVASAYGTTLYSFTNKPLLFKNNLPALLIMLCAWTLERKLAFASRQRR
ncbi:MAG: DUF2029 domain-containing protein [bacterium]|nr:DUF2029 domain-containing protein [bacterium]